MYSGEYEIEAPVIIQVDAFLEEKIELKDVLGVGIQVMLADVLRVSGASLGWSQVGDRPGIYLHKIDAQVAVQIDVRGTPVIVRRIASEQVEEQLRDTTQARLNQHITQLQMQYNTTLNELLDVCYLRSIDQAIQEMSGVETGRVVVRHMETLTVKTDLYVMVTA